MKRDFSPFLLDCGNTRFYLARHFGFCYGVKNAIEIAFRTIEENPGRQIYLLSEMIHNPAVNEDLLNKGVRFLQDTRGNQLIPFEELKNEDIVLIPAFGTTLEIENKLRAAGVSIENYNTTCPFVEKVWNRSNQIGSKKYTVIIHGKPGHEETRATFSHASATGPALILKDMTDAISLSEFINGSRKPEEFYAAFEGRYSSGFDISKDIERIGVVNQTTMLASDTQGIAEFLKMTMAKKFDLNDSDIPERFADTRDTLCYATNDNQSAVYGMLEIEADLAIVVGGYNSSNTSHLVELCSEKLPTYFISHHDKITDSKEIIHFDLRLKKEIVSKDYLPEHRPVTILLTSGASCPDALVELVIKKLIEVTHSKKNIAQLTKELS